METIIAVYRGTLIAEAKLMAAVFALVFLFVVASIALMLKALNGSLGFGGGLAMACFVMLASGVFVALFKLARRWENEAPSGE